MTFQVRPKIGLLFAIAMGVIVAVSAAGYRYASYRMPHTPIAVKAEGGIARFTVEVATTAEQQERGLMYRKALAPDAGMLFDLETEKRISIWMKNTLIPLDIMFISGDGTIVQIAANAQPFSEKIIASRVPVRAVLEINGGRTSALGIVRGDKVLHKIFGDTLS